MGVSFKPILMVGCSGNRQQIFRLFCNWKFAHVSVRPASDIMLSRGLASLLSTILALFPRLSRRSAMQYQALLQFSQNIHVVSVFPKVTS